MEYRIGIFRLVVGTDRQARPGERIGWTGTRHRSLTSAQRYERRAARLGSSGLVYRVVRADTWEIIGGTHGAH